MRTRLIALLFEHSTLNGGEHSMLSVVDWLKRNGERFDFMAIAPPVGRLATALRQRQIPIREWSTQDASGNRQSSDELRSSLIQIVNSSPFDLLHGNSLSMGRLAGAVATDLTIPTTAHLRDIIKVSRQAIADLNGNQKLFAVSSATRDFHVQQGLETERVVVVRNGIDPQTFKPGILTDDRRTELELQPEFASRKDQESNRTSLVATIGQISLRKGQDVLAAAAPLVANRIPNVHFLLIGERTSQKDESVRFEQAIRERFQDARLSDRLHFLGYRENIHRLLNQIDVLVHPANQEPFGRVLLEASAAGVPIVATNVGGTAEIIVHGETGLLVPRADPVALAEGIIELLTNKARADRFRLAARERTLAHFDISQAATATADQWRRLLS